MSQVNDQVVRQLVEKVLQQVESGWGGRVPPTPGKGAEPPITGPGGQVSAGTATRPPPAASVASRYGQFQDVNQAVEAAKIAQEALRRRSLAQREQICQTIRRICRDRAEELGRMEYQETQLGHPPHKIEKMILAADDALGVEALRTECFSGDHGITLEERGPWGVIGVITPVTHSLPTLAINAVNMIAAGNSLVCNPHPKGKKIAAYGARLFNEAIYKETGIDNLISVIVEPTVDTAKQIFSHPDVQLLAVTGGPGVVAAAMKSGKRAICAGPGNPPVVVDASADLDNAARCIMEGASYDNNLLCCGEKEVFVVAEVFEAMMEAMSRAGAHRLSTEQMNELAKVCIDAPADGGVPHANKAFVGASPQRLAEQIRVRVPDSCRLLYGETSSDHPFVQAEQMMPVIPVVRCGDFEQAVDLARQAEHGYRHTSIIHSRLVDHMTYMGKAMETTLFVKNGPSVAGNGMGGEGYGNYSNACTTGEGVCTPNTFTRWRRCTMVDNLRIV